MNVERWIAVVWRVVLVAVLMAVLVASAWAIRVSFVQHLLDSLSAYVASIARQVRSPLL